MLLIGAMALAPLTLLGAAGERLGHDRWLKTNTVELYGHIPNWPDERLRPLLEQFEELLLEQCVFRNIFGII